MYPFAGLHARSPSSVREVRGRSTRTYSVLLSEEGEPDSAPGRSFVAREAVFSCGRRAPWAGGNVLSMGVRRWLSLRRGGEDRACFRRSSVSRSLASRASSSWAWVETACFLAESAGARARLVGLHALLVHLLVQDVDAAVEPEQVVELRHEVAGDGRLWPVVGLPSEVGVDGAVCGGG